MLAKEKFTCLLNNEQVYENVSHFFFNSDSISVSQEKGNKSSRNENNLSEHSRYVDCGAKLSVVANVHVAGWCFCKCRSIGLLESLPYIHNFPPL